MAENEVHAGTTTNKHDDFFDDPPKQNVVLTPEHPKENGEVQSEAPKQNGDASPVPPETADSANGEEEKAGDEDATVVVNGDHESQWEEEEQNDGAADGAADVVQPEADAQSEAKPEEDEEVDKPNGVVEQMNGEASEQDGVTSHPPTPTVESTQEVDGNTADDEKEDEEKTVPEQQESEPTTTETKYEEESKSPEEEGAVQGKEEEQEQKLEQEQERTQPNPTEQEGERRRTPSGGEDSYNDSFSDDSSLKNGAGGGMAADTNEEEVQAPVTGEGETEQGEPGTDPPPTAVSPSPSDSRAEAGAVVPVLPVADESKVNDGRSSVTADEQGELFRGEDRKEEPAPEGSEDCRGQGQWKSQEQQYIASAMLVEKSDKEALEEAVKEKEKFQEEYSEAKVKDLQERLAILARENEQKDKRIGKLEQDLIDVTDKLRETERKLFATEKLNLHQQEAPKSKTCSIM